MGGGRQPQRPAAGLAWQQQAQEQALATALEASMPHACERLHVLQRSKVQSVLGCPAVLAYTPLHVEGSPRPYT